MIRTHSLRVVLLGSILLSVLFPLSLLAQDGGTQNVEAAESYNKGLQLTRAGKYAEAIGEFRASLKLDSTNVTTLYALGVAYKRNKEYDKAIETYQKAVTINPRYAEAHYALGLIHQSKGNHTRAI